MASSSQVVARTELGFVNVEIDGRLEGDIFGDITFLDCPSMADEPRAVPFGDASDITLLEGCRQAIHRVFESRRTFDPHIIAP